MNIQKFPSHPCVQSFILQVRLWQYLCCSYPDNNIFGPDPEKSHLKLWTRCTQQICAFYQIGTVQVQMRFSDVGQLQVRSVPGDMSVFPDPARILAKRAPQLSDTKPDMYFIHFIIAPKMFNIINQIEVAQYLTRMLNVLQIIFFLETIKEQNIKMGDNSKKSLIL